MSCRTVLVLLLLPAACAHTAASRSAQPAMGARADLAITHVNVIDVADGSVRSDQTVLISGSRIAAVGPSQDVRLPAGPVVIDARGKYLIPGLWDMHAHAASDARVESFFRLLLANGITGFRDPFGSRDVAARATAAVAAGELPGPAHIIVAGNLVDGPPGSVPGARIAATPEDGRRMVDSLHAADAPFIKVYFQLAPATYFAIAERSRQLDIPFVGHVPMFVRVADASDAGQRSIEHLTGVLTGCSADEAAVLADWRRLMGLMADGNIESFTRQVMEPVRRALATQDETRCRRLAERFVANQTWQVPTLVSLRGKAYLRELAAADDPRTRYFTPPSRWTGGSPFEFRMTEEQWEILQAQYEREKEIVGMMAAAGVPFLAGSDTPTPWAFPGFGLHDELELLVEAGLTPLQALQAATLNPARFFERTEDLGTVAAGRFADLVLLEANPLEDIANTRRISAVISDGRLYRVADLERFIADVERDVAVETPTHGHDNDTTFDEIATHDNDTTFDEIATHDNQIATHDNVRPAGRLQDGVLSLSLWAGAGDWYPEGEGSRPRRVAAFGEEGGPLSIPSPLLRVPEGTVVHVAIRNTFNTPLRVHGFCDRTAACEAVTVPAGETARARFALPDTGTFHYWATTADRSLTMREDDSQLGGAIVVDPPGADVHDRVFVLGMLEEESGGSITEFTVINGRSWPHTERLEYGVGDTVRWRLANLTAAPHALHLHGFYFHVESAGNGTRDTHYSGTDRRLAVTEQVMPGGTTTLSWIPERAGNWLFHCHMLVHMHPVQHGATAKQHVADETAAGMAGLVLGVHVTGSHQVVDIPDAARRPLRLIIEPDTRSGATASYRVDLVAGADPPPRVSDRAVPGPVMVLTRGEPVAVEVVNRLNEPTAIHWHGIELESYDDGVAGFSGTAGSVTPPVAAGGTFTARFTPSRAGTFMYHAHWHDPDQLAGGIYGPLIVLEPAEPWDPVSDHIIMLGLDGPYRPAPDEGVVVNGEAKPRPLELKAGMVHRLRFINITADNVALTVQLLSGFDPDRWVLVGKDGADTPPAQRAERPARQLVAVGETYDFELAPMTPRAVGLWLELRRGTGELLIQWPVRVR